MKYKKIIVFVLFLILQKTFVNAQVYPVQGSAALVPPYSVYLADYTTRSTDRFIVNLVLANITRPELPVRLRLKIEGQNVTIETKAEYIGSQLLLQGGIQLRLTGTDLLEYFNPNNLNFSGITRREFEKTGALPQGYYQFCIEVLEYNRGVKISNTLCAPGWLILNDPPMVNIPRNNEKLRPTIPQNVVFQWTPRHTGTPNSSFRTNYELKMVEVWPANRNPNDAILTSPPILETETQSTSFIYGPAETPLEPGRRYAFRVKAKSLVGVEEYYLFKNDGYSEVFTFVYGDVCETPLNLSAQGTGASRFRASWDEKFNHTAFQIKFREANKDSEWFTANATLNEVEINSLKSNTLYEYQVSGTCGPFESPFTQVATVRTNAPPLAAYSCGVPIQNFNLDPATLTASLSVGDIIQAGDFQVQLTRVSGSNGSFTGEGTVVVPFLNNVKVKAKFSDILVNQENRMVKGYMNVTGAALDLVPDEVTALIDDFDQTLDKIEDGLNKAEDVVNDVSAALDQAQKVIDEIAAYLPDEILNEIKEAKNEIAAARTEMRDATTPETKAEAKVEVKKAKEKMKEAAGKALQYYAQTVKDMIRLFKEVISGISSEAKDGSEERKKNYFSVKSDLKGVTGDTSKVNGEVEIIREMTFVVDKNELNSSKDESAKLLFSKYEDYNALYAELQQINIILSFVKNFSSDEQIRALGDLLKQNGESLLKAVAMKLKTGESDELIKAFIKTEINNFIDSVADNLK